MKSVAKIFDELVAVDPSLADHKKETMKAIKALLAEKPDTKFDQDFANTLKKSLMESQVEAPGETTGFFARIGLHMKSHVRAYSGVFAALVITVVGVIGTQYFFAAPSVVAGNWSFEYKKIPYDVPSIDITFSRELDASSISKETVRFAPYIQGTPSLKEGNTISYKLDSKLKIGERYMITLSSDIKSKFGAKIGRDISYEFEAIAGAKAMRIIPEGELKNVSKNIVVLFNIPVIPLGSLAMKDKLPCPIEITPAIEGKCSWTSGSILEFIPSKPLPYATKYEVKVAWKEGLLYPLSEVKTVSFKTPNLEVIAKGDGFYPENGIPLEFNAPVKTADLSKIVKVQESQKEIAVSIATASGPSDAGRRFVITKNASPGLLYSTAYNVTLSGALMPADGNVAYTGATSFDMRSSDYLQNVQSYRNEYSETGSLKDTPEIYNSNSAIDTYIAKKDGFLVLNFGEDVDLAKTKPYLMKNGARTECKTSYMKTETSELVGGKWTTKSLDDKRRLKCELPDSLDYGSTYVLTIDQASNPHLRENVARELKTMPKFEASDFTYVSNTQGCMYFTNPLSFGDYGAYGLEKHLETEPKSPIRSVTKDGIQQYDEITGNSKIVKICKDLPGKIAYVIGTRFNPHETYTIRAKTTLLDAVGNPLVAAYEKKDIKAGDVTDSDRYAYAPSSKDVSVIPASLPLVVNFQTINLSQLDVEVCEMTKDEYALYLKDRYNTNYTPACQGAKVAKSLPVANKAWAIANNRFDLEKDVMERTFTSPFILVRSSVNGKYNQGYSGYRKEGRESLNVFVRSTLALALESGKNKNELFVTSMDGKQIIEGATLEGYSTNTDGKIVPTPGFKTSYLASKKLYELSTVPEIIIAQKDGNYGMITTSNDEVSNYDFGYIAGQSSDTKDFAYIYTDRPIYRPGDTVEFKGLLRTFEPTGYTKSKNTTGKVKLLKQDGSLFKEVPITLDANSNFHGNFTIPTDGQMGMYTFALYLKGGNAYSYMGTDELGYAYIYNDASFYVEAYKKPVFKVNLSSDKKDRLIGDSTRINIGSEYYFGGNMVNTTFHYGVLAQSYFFDAKKYNEYQFGRGYEYFDCQYWGQCNFADSTITTGDGKIDENGKWNITFDYPKEAFDPSSPTVSNGEKIYTYNVEVKDPDTSKTVTNSYSEVLHTTDGYIGLRTGYSYPKNTDIRVEGVILTHDASPKTDAKGTIEVIHREWKVAKKQGVDGIFYDDYALEEKKEKEITVESNDSGEFQATFQTATDGEYEIRANYKGSNGNTFTSSRTIYVESDRYLTWNNGNNSLTDLVAEKSVLKPGDTAVFTLKSPVKSGKYFVSIEKDDAIIDSYVKDITGYSEKIELPIQTSFIPNIYVKVYLIGQDEKMDLPVYKRALAVIKVVSDEKKLSVEVVPSKTRYLPADPVEVTVRVKDSEGKPVANANGSLSIVDESVLALMGNPQKNPFAFFYDMKRYLGTRTYLSLTNLIEKLEVKNTGNGEKGGAGDGQKGGDAKKKRGTFKDTAFWKSDFNTDANGEAKISTDKLPDNLTTWVIESVVSTPVGNKVGVGRASIMTTKALLISENLPRFLISGDKVTLAPSIFNKTGKDTDITVSASADNADMDGSAIKMRVKNGESTVVRFKMTPHSNPEVKPAFASKITFRATDVNGNEDVIEATLPIYPPSTPEQTSTTGKTSDVSADERIQLEGMNPESRVEIKYSASALGGLKNGMEYLREYPYASSWNRTYALVPNIEMKKLYDSMGEPFDLSKIMLDKYINAQTGYIKVPLKEAIQDYLATIGQFQKNNWGFTYWNDTPREYPDFALTAYVVRTIGELKVLGFPVDSGVESQAVKYLRDRFYAGTYENCTPTAFYDCKYSEGARLGAIEAILKLQPTDTESRKMFKLVETKTFSPSDVFVYLRTIAALADQKDLPESDRKTLLADAKLRIDTILKNDVVVNPRGAFVGGYGEYSRIENTAAFVEAVSLLGRDQFKDIVQVIDNMNRFLLGSKKADGGYGSPNETASIIRSLSVYLSETGELKDVDMVARIKSDENLLAEQKIVGADRFTTFSKSVLVRDLPKNSTFVFDKTGKGSLYYDITLSYTLPTKDILARDEGFYVDTQYYLLSEYKRVEALKSDEWKKYVAGEIEYATLKYPKDIVNYLTPQSKFKVGDLVFAYTRLITSEARKQPAFEGFIPSGAELVNTKLATETKEAITTSAVNIPSTDELSGQTQYDSQSVEAGYSTSLFDHEEYRDDRYFATASTLDGGDYGFAYTIRMTHAGTYSVRPSRAFEFSNSEVFGRSAGKEIVVE